MQYNSPLQNFIAESEVFIYIVLSVVSLSHLTNHDVTIMLIFAGESSSVLSTSCSSQVLEIKSENMTFNNIPPVFNLKEREYNKRLLFLSWMQHISLFRIVDYAN